MGWEWFNTAAGAASLGGLILAAILGAVSWRISRATDRLISQGDAHTQAILAEMDARHTALLERMDQRADDRHREVVQVIQTLRP